MKKILSLVLALTLILGITPAFADAYRVQITRQADAAGLSQLLTALGYDDSEAEQLSSLLTEIYNKINTSILWTPQDFSLDISLDGKELLDLTVVTGETEQRFSTNLLPGIVLTQTGTFQGISLDSFLATDWSKLGEILASCATEWLNQTTMKTETGSFMGDAYSGGAIRKTYSITDRDLSVLYMKILEEAAPLFGTDQELLTEAKQIIYDMAWDGKLFYLFSLVYASDGETLIGCSLTIYDAQDPIATLSLGVQDETWHVVIGAGIQNEIYYLSLILKQQTSSDKLSVSLEAELLKDSVAAGYAAAAASPEALLVRDSYTADLQVKGSAVTWTAVMKIRNSTTELTGQSQGEFNTADMKLKDHFSLYASPGDLTPCYEITLAGQHVSEEISAPSGEMTVVEMDLDGKWIENPVIYPALLQGLQNMILTVEDKLPGILRNLIFQ